MSTKYIELPKETNLDRVRLYYRRSIKPKEEFKFDGKNLDKEDYALVFKMPLCEFLDQDPYSITQWLLGMAISSSWFKNRKLRGIQFGDVIEIGNQNYITLSPSDENTKYAFRLEAINWK